MIATSWTVSEHMSMPLSANERASASPVGELSPFWSKQTSVSLRLSALPIKDSVSRLSNEMSNWSVSSTVDSRAQSSSLPWISSLQLHWQLSLSSSKPPFVGSLSSSNSPWGVSLWPPFSLFSVWIPSTFPFSRFGIEPLFCSPISSFPLCFRDFSRGLSFDCLNLSHCLTLLCITVAAFFSFRKWRLSLKRLKAAWMILTALSNTASWNFSISLLQAL